MVEPLTDCPGIKHKLQLQPHGSSKHQAEIDLVSPPKIPCHAEKSKINPVRSPDAQRAEDLTKSPPSQSSDIHPTATAQSKSQKSKGKSHLAPVPLDLSNKAGSVGPPLKSIIWPCDFSVSQIVTGLALISAKRDGRMTQQDAFHKVFPGAKYHKGQITSVWTILSWAGEKLKNHHSQYGQGPKGAWNTFKKHLPNMILDKNFVDQDVITTLENELSSPCLSDNNVLWDNDKSLAISKPHQAPSDAISLSYSPSDMDFVPISQCPWCNLEIPTDFEPLATLLHSVRNS